MAINFGLYPKAILTNPLTPYVYFLNLPDEILDSVASEFNQNLSSFTDPRTSNNLNSIEQAFSFLKSVISSERAKEDAFLRYLKEKTVKTLDLEIPSIESDWTNFVQEIQKYVGFSNNGLTDLSNELNRLRGNKEKFEKALQANPELTKTWGIADTVSKVSDQMTNILKFFNTNFSPSSNAYKIIETIVMRYKDQLLAFDSNKELILDQKALMAAIELISTDITHLYISNPELFQVNGQTRFDASKINELLDQDTQMDENIKNMIKNMQQLPGMRDSVTKSLHLNNNQRSKHFNINDIVQGETIIDNSGRIMEKLYNMLKSYKVPEKAFQIIKDKPTWAEIESLTKMVISGAVSGHNTGSSFAKPDNIIGYFSVDPSQMDPSKNENIKLLIDRITLFQEKLKQVAQNVTKENTTEYYKQQSYIWNELSSEIDSILTELKDTYGILAQCFIIEDSTKNYLSLYAKKENNELETGPHGGSLGANLTDQLNKIDTLTRAGGISMIDKQWLTAAIINSGENMIANKQKTSLEDYLAMFAAILLFDSQINIAQEAFERSNLNNLNTSVHQIHLFSVNGGYYPLSYVLKLTYDSLVQGFGQIANETRQGVQVQIYGHISQPIFAEKPEDSWNATAQAALASTKIKMRFLVNLMQTIANLLPE